MTEQTAMDKINMVCVSLAQGAVAGWIAVQIGGVTGMVVTAILMATYFMVTFMHMRLHYKLWGDYLTELIDRLDEAKTAEEAARTYDTYLSVTAAIYEK